MNDSERVKVADVIETELDSYCPSPFNGAFAVSLMQIIDRLLTDRAVPEPAADAVERVATDEWRRLGGEKSNGSIRIDDYQFTDLVLHILPAVPEPDAAAGNALDAVTLAYMKGWQDGQAAAGDDLDAMLNNIHPNTTASLQFIQPYLTTDPEPYWQAHVNVPTGGLTGFQKHRGTGPTRMAAIADAVRQAKENGDG